MPEAKRKSQAELDREREVARRQIRIEQAKKDVSMIQHGPAQK